MIILVPLNIYSNIIKIPEYTIIPYVILSNKRVAKEDTKEDIDMNSVAYYIDTISDYSVIQNKIVITDEISEVKKIIDINEDQIDHIIFDMSKTIANAQLIKLVKRFEINKIIMDIQDFNKYETELHGIDIIINKNICPYIKCNSLCCIKKRCGDELCGIEFDSSNWFFFEGGKQLPYEEQQRILRNHHEWKQWLDNSISDLSIKDIKNVTRVDENCKRIGVMI